MKITELKTERRKVRKTTDNKTLFTIGDSPYSPSVFTMFNPTRAQIYFAVAVLVGVIVGRLIKNFKIGMIIAILLGTLMTFGLKRK